MVFVATAAVAALVKVDTIATDHRPMAFGSGATMMAMMSMKTRRIRQGRAQRSTDLTLMVMEC